MEGFKIYWKSYEQSWKSTKQTENMWHFLRTHEVIMSMSKRYNKQK